MEAKLLLPAAQYVRMSTEDQQYSIANQEDAIRTYAKKHGCVVVATYADEGKSGIEIKHRKGLRRLLSDVVDVLLSVGRNSSTLKAERVILTFRRNAEILSYKCFHSASSVSRNPHFSNAIRWPRESLSIDSCQVFFSHCVCGKPEDL